MASPWEKSNGASESEGVSCPVVSDSLQPHGLSPARFLCPWNSPGRNTGVGCHSHLQGNLPDPGIEPRSSTLQADALLSEPPGKPEKTIIQNGTCTPVFTAALFTIARTWKQSRCPSADKWIRKLWYIYTMEYYWAVKKNAFESVLRWMKRAYYTERSKSERKTPIQYINIYIEFRKMVTMTLYIYMWDSKRDTHIKNSLLDSGRRQRWDDLRE